MTNDWCVCVCVLKRGRESERESVSGKYKNGDVLTHFCMISYPFHLKYFFLMFFF